MLLNSAPNQCIFCGSPRLVFWQTKAAGRNEYNVWKCAVCGSGFVWPRPGAAELASFYHDAVDYWGGLSHWELDAHYYPTSSQEAEAVLRECRSLTGGRRLLDVGAGRGTYSRVAL